MIAMVLNVIYVNNMNRKKNQNDQKLWLKKKLYERCNLMSSNFQSTHIRYNGFDTRPKFYITNRSS